MPNNLPKHIAIIMDGNGRYAKRKGLPRVFGHTIGIKRVKEIVTVAREIGIEILTLYTFSTENWNRSKIEVSTLLNLLKKYLNEEIEELHSNSVVFNVLGDLTKFPKDIQKLIEDAINLTKNNKGLILNLALNYGARDEIIKAVNNILKSGKKSINEQDFHKYLYTNEQIDPDLLIRTGGEKRVSNFLLWQLAYTEMLFINKFWPDFRKKDFLNAVEEFKNRERRFGK